MALPVHRDSGGLRRAFACIAGQTLAELDIVLVLNGSDRVTRDTAQALARGDARARVIELPDANLSAALNTALEAARFDLVARMDADDECPPQRLALQAETLARRPEVAAIGSAWELTRADGTSITVVRPPTEPDRLRWRLLLGNVLAHGSMMLRRREVLAAGGYDAARARAQDFDLWLRLARAHGIACLPDVLYRHRVRNADDPARSTDEQAGVVAEHLLRAWRGLPAADNRTLEQVEHAVAAILRRDRGPDALAVIERELDAHGPARETLLAWLWTRWSTPHASRRAIEAGRAARLREVGRSLRDDGVARAWLWGAGDHTRWVLENARELGVPVAGIVDDHAAGAQRFGFTVQPPAVLSPGDTAIISTDWHEDSVWESSRAHRDRGVRVVRLYGDARGANTSS